MQWERPILVLSRAHVFLYQAVQRVFVLVAPAKGQLNSEWIYEVIFSPKMPTKITKISALPSNKLPGQKSFKLKVVSVYELKIVKIESCQNWKLPK